MKLGIEQETEHDGERWFLEICKVAIALLLIVFFVYGLLLS